MVPNDPYYSSQWHYALLGDIQTIWNEYNGAGVHVGVYDSGVDATNPDLAPNYDASREVVYNGVTYSGAPNNASTYDQSHGTAVAGLIAAAGNNGIGVIGGGWGASITGVNVYDSTSPLYLRSSDRTGSLAALHQMTNFDVINNSWGYPPAFRPSNDIVQEYAYGSANGRGGLGTVIVQSAGNNGNRNAGFDGINASRYTITVAAALQDGTRASYSNSGASILITAPGSDASGSIVTTDRSGSAGFNAGGSGSGFDDTGNYTATFNGTSAAAPIVSGVVTLMLQANAGLGWRDVQNILANSATRTGAAIDPATARNEDANFWKLKGGTEWNGGGNHFSVSYGYGMLNAFNAVRMAEAWNIFSPTAQTSANEQSISTGTLAANTALTDNGTTSYTFTVSDNLKIEHVGLTLSFTHDDRSQLSFNLIAPDGSVSRVGNLAAYTGSGELTWTYPFDDMRGMLAAGTWTLKLIDNAAGGTGTLNSVKFTAYGTAVSTGNVYHYTDEFSDMAALSGQNGRTVLNDTDGGSDWIDAAAVHLASTVDLGAGTATIDGVALTVSGVENVVAGDGADSLTGNSDDNKLYGMRGSDTLNGGAGTDELHGGAGNDTLKATLLDGSTPGEIYDGGDDTDTLRLGNDVADGTYLFDLRDDTLTSIERLTIQSPGSGNTAYVALLAGQIGSGLSSYAEIVGNTASDVVDILFVTMDSATFVDLSAMSFGDFANPSDQVVITGDDNAEYIIGSRVHDVINGNGGADTLNGSGGADDVHGAGGDDTIVIDLIDGQAAGEVYDGGDDTDTLRIINTGTLASYTQDLSDDTLIAIEKLRFAVSSEASTATVQLLAGQIGGGLSATAQVVGIAYADVTDTLALTMGSATSLNLSGLTFVSFAGPSDSVTVIGDGDAETIIGSGVRDVIDAGGGADRLDGRAGADILIGGAGSDTYLIDNAGDRVTEARGGGTDAVATTVTYALAAGQEVEELRVAQSVGDRAVKLTGNEFAQTLKGNGGANTLDGKAGADTLIGGGGNDTYLVDNAGDKVVEAAGGGRDAVATTVTYTLTASQEIEELRIAGAAGDRAINLTGNAIAQTLIGNDGANVLNGAFGNDVLTGRGGADTFVFANAPGSTNVDRIIDFASEDTIQLSKSVFKALALGELDADAFKIIDTVAADTDDRILYKQTTGELFYDADGSGRAAALKFAVLDNKAALTAADFFVV